MWIYHPFRIWFSCRFKSKKKKNRANLKSAKPTDDQVEKHIKRHEKEQEKKTGKEWKRSTTEIPEKSKETPSTSPQQIAPQSASDQRQQMVAQAMRKNDEVLDEISGVVSDLKVMALEMSVTLDTQNETIDQIACNVGSADTKLRKDNKRIHKQLK